MKNIINSKYSKIILIIVAVVLLVLLLVFALVQKPSDNESSGGLFPFISKEEGSHVDFLDSESEKNDKGENILLIPKEEVYSFKMTDSHGILLNFERKDEGWVYIDDITLNINSTRIDKVLNYLTDIKFVDSIVTDKPEDYGLSQDSLEYAINDANGNTTLISLGNVDESTGNVYFALNYDFSTIYVNEGKLKNVSEYAIEDLIAVK
ncbi:DUF4340 domain-containing protein [Pseudobutyrivibrio ruminis]|uniref:DUF4340 domain-containing protein n=1 Tax=Pseudobutyrivibrio ruminis TaxID=46206 RepID=UPI000408C58F|nr:DUF4340 domain-containing protein [Pseudobutyrivibrio ruminis]